MREILGLVQPSPIFLYRFGSKQGYHFKANQSRLFKHKVDVNHRALETPFTLALLKKKNLQLTWDNKILTMENLAKRGYSRISTITSIFCHEAKETVDYLLITC